MVFVLCIQYLPGIAANPEQAVTEKFFKVHMTESNILFRIVLVPDFRTIGGNNGFLKLLPRILALHPSVIFINATDVFEGRADKDLKAALRIMKPIHCKALFD